MHTVIHRNLQPRIVLREAIKIENLTECTYICPMVEFVITVGEKEQTAVYSLLIRAEKDDDKRVEKWEVIKNGPQDVDLLISVKDGLAAFSLGFQLGRLVKQ